ncbi:MAG TPA: EAL domain-containing protein [Burkholderiaceae bacterium]
MSRPVEILMDVRFDSSLAPLLWTVLSLAVGIVSTLLALGWAELSSINTAAAKLRRLAGVGISMGTGLWALRLIGLASDATPMPRAGADTDRLGAEIMLWLLGAVVGMLAFGWPETRKTRLSQRLFAATGLATGALALQVAGLFAIDAGAFASGRDLNTLAGAWMLLLAACLGAFGLRHALRDAAPKRLKRARLGAGALIGSGLLLSQHLVRHAAALPVPSAEGAVTALIANLLPLLGAGALLYVSNRELQRQLKLQASRTKARRKRDAESPNDPLTGLPTRQLFEGALSQAVRRADAANERLALLMINLDGFKPVNQSFGHLGGDQVLREVAARVRSLSKPHMAARLGGDEFMMLLNENPDIREASRLAVDVIAALGAPYRINGRAATLACSIGIAMYPEHGAKSTMIAHAQAAMGAAKSAGGASHSFFEARMLKTVRDDVELLRDLRVALEREQLELYYQPKIHAPTGEITGAEALMRWHHPQRGMISPVVFIPLAERFGLINTMGRWVVDEACRQARAWRDEGLRMRVAVNLSVHQLRQPDLADWIRDALARHQINPDLLTCEVTESSAMDDTDVTMRVLKQLDAVGVHISIDDFGTGHSSLAYLRKLPADELKIDRSFVMDLETSEDARKVAVAVVNLAKALNLKVVAEGVETEGQNRLLREFGCDQLQGYLFAKPMSAKALTLWAMDDVGPRTMNFRDSLFKETRQAEELERA